MEGCGCRQCCSRRCLNGPDWACVQTSDTALLADCGMKIVSTVGKFLGVTTLEDEYLCAPRLAGGHRLCVPDEAHGEFDGLLGSQVQDGYRRGRTKGWQQARAVPLLDG